MKSDITLASVNLYFIPVQTRVPLKFGPETLTSVICARVCVTVANGQEHAIELGSDFIESVLPALAASYEK